jgi:hypothetical protein
MGVAGISRPKLRAARWPLALAVIACAGLPVVHASGFVPAALQTSDEMTVRAQAALGVLRDGSAPEAQRLEAAKVLIELSELPVVRTAFGEILSPPLGGTGGGDQLLAALAKTADAPARLYPLISQRLATAAPEEMARIIEALGSFRTREAAKVVGRYLMDNPPSVESAAMASLARLSARDDLGQDKAAWAAWLREVDGMTEPQWRLRLISALAARNDRLAAQRHDAVAQLTDALRKLHLATKVEERPALLASLLEDDIPAVRNLGFELVARELSVTGHLDGPVGLAALRLLRHPDPQVRSSAAVLVRQLAPLGAEQAVAVALGTETDAHAASDLLLAAARWPSRPVVAPMLRWIQSGTPAADAATEAAWWLFRSGGLTTDEAAQVLAAVRRTLPESLMPSGVSLLAALGDEEDRAGLVPLLNASSPALRQAAGEALLWYPEHRGAILAAAAKDPDLFDIASRAVGVDEPTAEGLRSLLALPKPSPELTRTALLRVVSRVPADELHSVCGEVSDAALKRALLANLASPERVMSEKSEPKRMAAIAAGVCDLAELDLAQRQAESALATLDAATYAEGAADAKRLACLRSTALLALGRVDDAQSLDATADAWIRGLEMAHGASAGRVLLALEAKFADLTPEEKARVEAVRATIKPEDLMSAVEGPPSPP